MSVLQKYYATAGGVLLILLLFSSSPSSSSSSTSTFITAFTTTTTRTRRRWRGGEGTTRNGLLDPSSSRKMRFNQQQQQQQEQHRRQQQQQPPPNSDNTERTVSYSSSSWWQLQGAQRQLVDDDQEHNDDDDELSAFCNDDDVLGVLEGQGSSSSSSSRRRPGLLGGGGGRRTRRTRKRSVLGNTFFGNKWIFGRHDDGDSSDDRSTTSPASSIQNDDCFNDDDLHPGSGTSSPRMWWHKQSKQQDRHRQRVVLHSSSSGGCGCGGGLGGSTVKSPRRRRTTMSTTALYASVEEKRKQITTTAQQKQQQEEESVLDQTSKTTSSSSSSNTESTSPSVVINGGTNRPKIMKRNRFNGATMRGRSTSSSSSSPLVVDAEIVKDDTTKASTINGSRKENKTALQGVGLGGGGGGGSNDTDSDDESFEREVERLAAMAARDLQAVMDELNTRVTDGTASLLTNFTDDIDDKLNSLPEKSATELTNFLDDISQQIQDVQKQELAKQLNEIEKRFLRPLEDLVFNDVPLLMATGDISSSYSNKKKKKSKSMNDSQNTTTTSYTNTDEPDIGLASFSTPEDYWREYSNELILMGRNSTLSRTTNLMRTRDIVRNFNVAPFYYSIALLTRWLRKASYSRIYLLAIRFSSSNNNNDNSSNNDDDDDDDETITTATNAMNDDEKGIGQRGGLGQTSSSRRKKNRRRRGRRLRDFDYMSGERLQAGWKRTGEIAAKGTYSKKWAIFCRSLEIWAYFSSFYLKDRRITSKYNKGKWTLEQYQEERSKLGKEITNNLLKLGPTFIKVGQLFSTRIDIVPKEYINELKRLQDNVPGFSGELAIKIIEEELGKPIHEIFSTFNTTSLAAASLGQVHVGTLRETNERVAIKIQRQYLRELFEVDLGQLRQVAIFADAIDLTSEGGLLDRNTKRDWVSVFEENKRLLYEEIDYNREIKNCDRFRENFSKQRSFRHIRVPRTYSQYTTDKVMVMEYLPGIKITNKDAIVNELNLDPVDISIKLSEAFLEQLCRHGFFHCDQHPGNVAVKRDAKTGEPIIIFYDFGMMDEFDANKRKGLVDFFFAIYYDASVRDACNALERLGMLRPTGPDIDRIAIERVGQDFIDRFQDTLRTDGMWDNELNQDEQRRLRRERRKQLGEEFLSLNRDSPFVFPATWTFVVRSIFSIDGIGKTLNPTYDLTKLTLPYLKELLDLKDGNAFKTTLLRLGQRIGLRPIDINQSITLPRRTAKIEDVVTRLEQGDFKLRVRTLEVERQLERSKLVERNIFNAALVSILLQCMIVISTLYTTTSLLPTTTTITTTTAAAATAAATNAPRYLRYIFPIVRRVAFAVATIFAIQIPFTSYRIYSLDKYNEKYGVRR